MSVRPNKPSTPSNQQLALEMVKAALLGGAVKGSSIAAQDIDNIDALNKQTDRRARLDSAYVVKLYRGILTRLEQDSAK